jgi:hypothetical protein
MTFSRQDCFKSCRKKAFFAYELGLRRTTDAKALRQGTAFHAGVESLGAMCFSLLRCRERGTEQARSDVVLAVQPLVEKYQDLHKTAVEKFDSANRELVAFIMGRVK